MQEIIYKFSITNRGWHTREVDRGIGTYATGYTSDDRVGDDSVA